MDVHHSLDVATRAAAVQTVADLARVLRDLRRREARTRGGATLTYRQIAARTGWSVAVVGQYLTGARLPSIDRLDELVRLLGAVPAEQGVLASARERVADARRSPPSPGQGPTVRPHMLPALVPDFVGRYDQRAALDRLVAAGEASKGAVVALAGMGGVGKTALAVRWAHDVTGGFPDGQLYIDLCGYSSSEPLTTVEAAGLLLSGLGVGRSAMPRAAAERLALYRRLLAGQRMLVVLDNASGSDQVRALLPPAPCLTLVTSRDDLIDLVALAGAHRVTLDVLPPDDSVALLRLLLGARAEREPSAARALASLCGQLPLALRVAAEHAAYRATSSLADLVDELRGEEEFASLDAFDTTGDDRSDIRVVFSWSVRRLPEPSARAFRLLGLLPGGDIDLYGLAALAGVDVAEAADLADTLERVHLLRCDDQGRLSMHDVLRGYAGESCEQEIPPAERNAAVTRLLDYYLHTVTVAVQTQYSGDRPARLREPAEPTGPTTPPEITETGGAIAWLLAERVNLVNACLHLAPKRSPRHAVALALALRRYLDDGHDHDSLAVHTEALLAAQRLGDDCDPADRAGIHAGLGFTLWRLGRLDAAAEHAERAVEESVRAGDHDRATRALSVLGVVRDAQGRFDEALACQQRGLELARAIGNRHLEGNQLVNLGYTRLGLEDFPTAADLYRQAADVFAGADEPAGLAEARNGMAMAAAAMGRLAEAVGFAEEAVALNDASGQVLGRLAAVDTLGMVYHRQGRHADAIELLTDALESCRHAVSPAQIVPVLNSLGEVHLAAGDHESATAYHAEALDLTGVIPDRLERARALVGLGDARSAAGDQARARPYWQEALDIYRDLGLPGADRLSQRLSTDVD